MGSSSERGGVEAAPTSCMEGRTHSAEMMGLKPREQGRRGRRAKGVGQGKGWRGPLLLHPAQFQVNERHAVFLLFWTEVDRLDVANNFFSFDKSMAHHQ